MPAERNDSYSCSVHLQYFVLHVFLGKNKFAFLGFFIITVNPFRVLIELYHISEKMLVKCQHEPKFL